MATTAIWDIKDNLKRVLDYASNPEKTEIKNPDYQFNGLNQVLTYSTQDLKTEKQLYVTGINCSLSTAFEEMKITKESFNKLDGIVAFHGYQSFKEGEVTFNMDLINKEYRKEFYGEGREWFNRKRQGLPIYSAYYSLSTPYAATDERYVWLIPEDEFEYRNGGKEGVYPPVEDEKQNN